VADDDLRFYNEIPAGESVEDALLRLSAWRASVAGSGVPTSASAMSVQGVMPPAPAPAAAVQPGQGLVRPGPDARDAVQVMDDYLQVVEGKLEAAVSDDSQPTPGVRAIGRFLVVTARPALQAEVAAFLHDFHRTSRGNASARSDSSGQAIAEGEGGGTGLIGR
jgi:hypothetical protein